LVLVVPILVGQTQRAVVAPDESVPVDPYDVYRQFYTQAYHVGSSDPYTAITFAKLAEEGANKTDDLLAKANTAFLLGSLYYQIKSYASGYEAYTKAESLYPSIDQRGYALQASWGRAVCLIGMNSLGKAEALLRTISPQLEKVLSSGEYAAFLIDQGYLYRKMSAWSQAQAFYMQASEFVEDSYQEALVRLWLGTCAQQLGQPHVADQAYQEVLKRCQFQHWPELQGYAEMNLGTLADAQEEWEQAELWLQKSQATFSTDSGYVDQVIEVSLNLSEVLQKSGGLRQAYTALAECLPLADQALDKGLAIRLYNRLMVLATQTGHEAIVPELTAKLEQDLVTLEAAKADFEQAVNAGLIHEVDAYWDTVQAADQDYRREISLTILAGLCMLLTLWMLYRQRQARRTIKRQQAQLRAKEDAAVQFAADWQAAKQQLYRS